MSSPLDAVDRPSTPDALIEEGILTRLPATLGQDFAFRARFEKPNQHQEFLYMDVSEEAYTPPHAGPLSAVVADLERKITLQTQGRIRDLRIEEVGDAVVLSGRTSTYYMKQLASQIALDESGWVTLQNSIEVV